VRTWVRLEVDLPMPLCHLALLDHSLWEWEVGGSKCALRGGQGPWAVRGRR
jgi:hypothetical protein